MDEFLIALLARAVGLKLLPPQALLPPEAHRPWPVVLLTALGAWLAALPLLVLVSMLFGGAVMRGGGTYLIGTLLVSAAVVVLRGRERPLFIEQLAVPMLLVGGGALSMGLSRDLGPAGGSVVTAGIAFALAMLVPAAWLRTLLGASVAGLLCVALLSGAFHPARLWLAWHVLLIGWLVLLLVQYQGLPGNHHAKLAPVIEALAAGWLVVTLAGLAFAAGMTFLVGGVLGAGPPLQASVKPLTWTGWSMQLTSGACASAAAGWLAASWPQLRRVVWVLPALLLIVLATLRPTLGGVLLALAVCATTQRWRLAVAATAAAAWIVGSFYYDLAWPLSTKAAVLMGIGVLLAIGARVLRWVPQQASRLAVGPFDRRTACIAASLVATLAVAGGAIWQKQRVIADGRAVFVELAPIDPRSLMQGDYMRLNFQLPGGVAQIAPGLGADRPRVAGKVDARGVATFKRVLALHEMPAADEIAIELTPRDGRWMLVTDAWFFREGDDARWSRAKYGEFRVRADGQALLVGMADASFVLIR